MHASLEEVVDALVAALADADAAYALLGGFAVNAYGFPRMTRDVDVCVDVHRDEADAVDRLLDALEGAGFRANRPAIRDRLDAGRGLITVYLGLTRLDVFLRRPDDAWGSVLANRRPLGDGEPPLWLASPEDIVAMKLAAGRARDLEDVRALVELNRDTMDLARLRDLVADLARRSGREDLAGALEELLAARV